MSNEMSPPQRQDRLIRQAIELHAVAQALWGADGTSTRGAQSWDELSEYGQRHYLNMATCAIIKLDTLRGKRD